MRAVQITGKNQLSVIETDKPQADGTKVVMKITDCGICGSDIHIWDAGREGLILGHEFGAIVVDPGALKDTLKEGDRITALPGNPCGVCESCRNGFLNTCDHGFDAMTGITAPGAYCEYFAIRPDMVMKLPNNVSNEEGAMLEPTAVALHAVRKAGVKPGDKVFVAGAGIIGLLCAAWARIAGASYIALSETNGLRAEKAKDFGDIDDVFDATDEKLVENLKEKSKGGFDHAFECAAVAPAVSTVIQAVKPRGRVLLLGINYAPVPVMTVFAVRKEAEIMGSFGYSLPDFQMSIDLMSRKIIQTERFIDYRVGLDGVQEAFERLSSGTSSDVKILIQP